MLMSGECDDLNVVGVAEGPIQRFELDRFGTSSVDERDLVAHRSPNLVHLDTAGSTLVETRRILRPARSALSLTWFLVD